MKRIVSIPLIFLILFTGVTINLASHYCSGTYIASKVSFSGKLATCGMEHKNPGKPGFNESDHVCEDLTSAYTLNSNYIPSAFHTSLNHEWFQFAELSMFTSLRPQPKLLPGNPDNKPPGDSIVTEVDLEVICIFRI